MALSRIIITFNTDLVLDQGIGFVLTGGIPIPLLSQYDFRWVNIRTGAGQVPVTPPNLNPGEISAIFFMKSFNIDYNGGALQTGIFNVTRFVNVVTIECEVDGAQFFTPYTVDQYWNPGGTQNTDVSFTIVNDAISLYGLTDLSFEEATTNPPCTHYKVSITTTILTDEVSGDVIIASGNTNNPLTFEMPRSTGFSITLHNSDPGSLPQSLNIFRGAGSVPSLLIPEATNIEVVNSPVGGTITIYVLHSLTITLEYSLDNVNWQSSNVFSGILDGTYTGYVRDQYGCSFSTEDIIVGGSSSTTPYHHISKALSIRYAERITEGDCGPYRNDENSLSHEAFITEEGIRYCEVQQFQSCDNITTQFKSNYGTNLAKVIKQDGTEDSLIVTQMTAFTGIKDARDAMKYNIGNGQTGIYFTSGNIYDYDSDTDTGEDHNLNGGLPEWAIIGNFLSISGAWFEIVGLIYDDSIFSEVIVINEVFTGVPTQIITKSIFNRQKYEVYEFTVPMLAYNNQNIQVQIDLQDSNFDDKIFLSEMINVKDKQENTVEISYYNSHNTDIFYKTGIKNILRLPIAFIRGDHEDESENTKGDDGTTLISSDVYEINEFEFDPVTKGIYWKLVQALSHKFITIDKVGYVKASTIEKEGPLEESNMYVVKAKMIKTAAPYRAGVVGIDPSIVDTGEVLEVPNLVITGNGEFISYVE